MGRTLSLKTGDPSSPILEVNVINTGATGLLIQQGGSGPTRLPGMGENDVVEQWRLDLRGSSHDNAASQWQTMKQLLNRAPLFTKGLLQKPVYIHAQTTGETNDRFSLVKMSLELEHPDVFAFPFEAESNLEGVSLNIVREKEWRDKAPGVMPVAMTLASTDGTETNPTEVFVTNHEDDAAISHIFERDDSAGTFSSSLAGDSTGFDLFNEHNANTPAAGDYIAYGADDPFFCVVHDLTTAFAGDVTFVAKYYNGSSFVDIGTKLLAFPEATIEDCLKTQGKVAFSWGELDDWAKTTINGENKYWVRIEIDTVTTWTTTPAQTTEEIYNQSKNYVEIPAASFVGDEPPLVMARVRPFHGGDENAGFRNISRLIIAANSDKDETDVLDKFVGYIPLGGNGESADWTIANVTDASSVSDPEAPGGQHCLIDFSTDATMEPRVRATGSGLLPYLKGDFRMFLHAEQTGGDAGDVRVRLKTYISGSGATAPHVFTPALGVKSRSADLGGDFYDLGLLRIPFADVVGEDTLPAVDLVFEVQAEQIVTGAFLKVYSLLPWPIKEGSVGPDDPITDNALGSSALRGGTALDIDPGVMAYRMQKHLSTAGGAFYPVETWPHAGRPPQLENIGERTRLYFILLNYTATNGWGKSPLVGTIGQAAHVQLYPHNRYSALRGAS